MNHTLCIFTPTFNRAHMLPKLHESLVGQDSKDFYWLIVDDGSTDATANLVDSFIKQGKVDIKYIRTKNGGKQRAWNTAALDCDAELFMCVDSDDYLTKSAVSVVVNAWRNASGSQTIAGIVTPRMPKNSSFPSNCATTFRDLYRVSEYKGETCIATRTSVMVKHLFPVAEGEKFIPESYSYDQIDREFKHLAINQEICLGNYMEDGYTTHYKQVLLSNPKSYALYKKQCILYSQSSIERLRETGLYLAWSFISKSSITQAIKGLSNRYEAITLTLPALIIAGYIKWNFGR